MPNVLVRDLRPDVHTELQRRAAQRGVSLQQYLAVELERLATLPSRDDVLARLDQRQGGHLDPAEVVEAVRAGRGDSIRPEAT